MVKGIIVVVLLTFSMSVNAQSEIYIKKGLVTSYGTFAPSAMLNRGESNYYFSGGLALRFADNYSFKGETHYALDGNKEIPYLGFAFRNYFGIQRHWSAGNFDFHVDFMPGFSVLSINNQSGELITYGKSFVPSLALGTGIRYYIWKYFNFFANATYVKSTLNNVRHTSGKVDELLFSAGLGLNLQVFNR